ncbi:MAG TPA: hypothetical protein PKA30_05770, partial [Accumulibacter sp.]
MAANCDYDDARQTVVASERMETMAARRLPGGVQHDRQPGSQAARQPGCNCRFPDLEGNPDGTLDQR